MAKWHDQIGLTNIGSADRLYRRTSIDKTFGDMPMKYPPIPPSQQR
jgi:hypothetical protein